MKKQRRIAAGILIILGGVLWWLAPETPGGMVMVLIGVVLEAVGIFIEHNRGVAK